MFNKGNNGGGNPNHDEEGKFTSSNNASSGKGDEYEDKFKKALGVEGEVNTTNNQVPENNVQTPNQPSVSENVNPAKKVEIYQKFKNALGGVRNAIEQLSAIWELREGVSDDEVDNLSYDLCNELFNELGLGELFSKSMDEYAFALSEAEEKIEDKIDASGVNNENPEYEDKVKKNLGIEGE